MQIKAKPKKNHKKAPAKALKQPRHFCHLFCPIKYDFISDFRALFISANTYDINPRSIKIHAIYAI